MPSVSGVVRSLGDCAWLDAARARAYARILLAVTLIGAVAGSRSAQAASIVRPSRSGPISSAFIRLLDWRSMVAPISLTTLASIGRLSGRCSILRSATPRSSIRRPRSWSVCRWRSRPTSFSLAVWLAATGFVFYRVLRGYLPSLDPVAFLAFPAVFVNAAHGQNAFLSAALIGGGFLVMNRRPVLAGACFGAMAYKPHLALVIPFALIFARRWTTLIVAAATAASFCLASLIAFGASTWGGFFADASFAGAALQNNLVGNEKMRSVFAAVRLLRGSLALAWGAQIVAALGAIGALWLLQWLAFRTSAEAPAVVCAG